MVECVSEGRPASRRQRRRAGAGATLQMSASRCRLLARPDAPGGRCTEITDAFADFGFWVFRILSPNTREYRMLRLEMSVQRTQLSLILFHFRFKLTGQQWSFEFIAYKELIKIIRVPIFLKLEVPSIK